MNVAIVGASGYAGQELMRIVLRHRHFRLEDAVSNSWSGKEISLLVGKNKRTKGLKFISVESFMLKYKSYDLIFLALPHGESAKFYMKIKDFDGKIIDLSSDFRLSRENRHIWKDDKHVCIDDLDKFIYGLSDIEESNIAKSNYIANPGCYATSILLAISPAISKYNTFIKKISVFAMSGVSGAGYKASMKNSYCEINENTYAYALKNHNHIAEMEDYMRTKYNFKTDLQFTPHLIAINRGISSTTYISLDDEIKGCKNEIEDLVSNLEDFYQTFYKDSEFVYIVDNVPQVKDVVNTNQCHIHVDYDKKTNNILVVSVIDNLVKGASGQAIQNANILCGYSSSEGFIGGYYENS